MFLLIYYHHLLPLLQSYFSSKVSKLGLSSHCCCSTDVSVTVSLKSYKLIYNKNPFEPVSEHNANFDGISRIGSIQNRSPIFLSSLCCNSYLQNYVLVQKDICSSSSQRMYLHYFVVISPSLVTPAVSVFIIRMVNVQRCILCQSIKTQ